MILPIEAGTACLQVCETNLARHAAEPNHQVHARRSHASWHPIPKPRFVGGFVLSACHAGDDHPPHDARRKLGEKGHPPDIPQQDAGVCYGELRKSIDRNYHKEP